MTKIKAKNRKRAPAVAVQRVVRRYEYRVTSPMLPPGPKDSPVMDHRQMEWWLNDMDAQGWEFVGYGEKNWRGGEPYKQEWWIFRRLISPNVEVRDPAT